MNAFAALLRGHLGDEPRLQAELVKLLEKRGWPRIGRSGPVCCSTLVLVPPSGTWE
jgi:hypothetical protein